MARRTSTMPHGPDSTTAGAPEDHILMSSQNTREYRQADRALLWSRSGGLCAFPSCDVICVQDASDGVASTIIGQIGHIEAHSNSGPRANPSLSEEQRRAYPNLILLCPTHHRLVDARDSIYTVDILQEWKQIREASFRQLLAETIANVTFVELEQVMRALVDNVESPTSPIVIIPPQEKMDRNGLTAQTARLVSIGLTQSNQVKNYVETITAIDRTFISRLISGFVQTYQEYRQSGVIGDELFDLMLAFTTQGKPDISHQCAALAVLVYLFERCEVFER